MVTCLQYAAHKSDVIVTGFGLGVYYIRNYRLKCWGAIWTSNG
jgi:hypothetical protein